ncbi:MAG: M48 family metallopeptidase [Proteobacteria bacterium]|nr:M48 family metallopeptidase [Pseudomonadota bacterium]
MIRPTPLIAALFACVASFGLGLPAPAQNVETGLPNIGSSARTIITPAEQDAYGQMTFRELRKEGYVLDDPLLEDWLQGIGDRLGAYSNKPSQKFHLFIVKSRDINAFATLGGYVAVNAGLILATTSEDELAGVMSHEFAHVTQDHVLRAVEKQSKAQVPIVLAMLAAIVLSSRSNSTSAANAGEAAMASGLGLIAQQSINFTRENETEADHLGIQTMARAGYDPIAMATFFQRMQAAYRSNEGYGKYKVPDFLIDHPVTSTRISDAFDRARQIKSRPQSELPADAATSGNLLLPAGLGRQPVMLASAKPPMGHDYLWARERLRVLSAESSGAAIAEYQKIRAANPAGFGDAQRYGLDLAMIEHGQADAALTDLRQISARHPGDMWIGLAIAGAQFHGGQQAAALADYDRLLVRWPGNRAVILTYANTLGQIGTPQAGLRAQAILRPLTDSSGDDAEFQQTFARACEIAGNTARAGEAYAVAAFLNGRPQDALKQLEALKQRTDLDYYERARVEARIEEYKPVVLEMNKQGIRPENGDPRPLRFDVSYH